MNRTATDFPVPNPIVEQEVARIGAMNVAELRAMWRAQMKSEPPKAFGPDLLRRSLAYRIQEKAYGGLDPKTSRLLNQLIAQSAKNAGKIILPRRTKPGTMMVREWKGKRHTVTVTEDGFAFEGQVYESLSEIARLITGTRWNGPRFFGLRSKEKTDVS
jgi:hypothetical protein